MLTTEKPMFSLNISTDFTFSSSYMNNSSTLSVSDGCVLKRVSQFLPWDNKDNLIPKKVDVIVNVLFTGIFLPLLFLISFSTNLVNMVVFYKHGLKERINMCLFTLSVVDCLCVTALYGYSSDVLYMFIKGKGDEIGPSGVFYIQTYLIGLSGLVPSSQFVSSVIALERCLCITRPLLAKSLMSTKKTAVVLWTLILTVTGVSLFVVGVRFGVVCTFDPRNNSTSYSVYPRKFFIRNKKILDFMYSGLYGLFLPAFCGTCVTVSTIATVFQMKKMAVWREEVSSASRSLTSRDITVTRMIVGTSLLFIGCMVPSTVVRASLIAVPELRLGGKYDNLHSVFMRLYLLASVTNCTFNFFIYYAYGTKFRETVHRLCQKCVCYPKKMYKGQT